MMKAAFVVALVMLLGSACASSVDDAVGPTSVTPSSVAGAESASTTSPPTTTPSTLAADSTAPPSSTATTEPPGAPEDACVTRPSVGVGITSETIESGGLSYDTQWTVPTSYSGQPLPVVLNFHGIGSNGSQQSLFSGLGTLAEREGFVAVHPTGLASATDDRASWELPQFDDPVRDDVQFVRDLLDTLSAAVCVDAERVFALGMSNGGFFSSVLVCDLSERLAGAVAVAGVTHDDSCSPETPVPFMAFHGVADNVVPFDGSGVSTLPGAELAGAFFEQVPKDEFAEFATDFACTGSEDSSVSELVTRTTWTGCADDVEVAFYAIADGGHTWPGSAVSAAIPTLGVTNLDIDATELAWDFFQRAAPVVDG